MSDSSITISGVDEINAALDELTIKAERAVLREGMKAAADQVVGSMQAAGSACPGEIGEALADPGSWTRGISILSGHAAKLSVRPKGSLPEKHTDTGKGRQPKGHMYQRSLEYLLNLMEFGPKVGKTSLPLSKPMTDGWNNSKVRAYEAFISNVKQVLGL